MTSTTMTVMAIKDDDYGYDDVDNFGNYQHVWVFIKQYYTIPSLLIFLSGTLRENLAHSGAYQRS